MDTLVALGIALLTLVVGYYLGAHREHRSKRADAYAEGLAPMISFALSMSKRTPDRVQALNRSIALVWLYAPKKTARLIDQVLTEFPRKVPDKETVEKLQSVIAAMRDDVQLWPFTGLKPSEIKHFCFKEDP